MILFFGPPGAGKSLQGQMLAARHGWSWISTGQLFRQAKDPEVLKTITAGHLIDDQQTNTILLEAFAKNKDASNLILDGYPRKLSQANWLAENQAEYGRAIDLCVVLEVPHEELLKRIKSRGRGDDTPESIEKRLNIYHQEVDPILDYFASKAIPIIRINGSGSVGQVHDRIEAKTSQILESDAAG